jgi:DNA adenine methylase
MENAKRIYIPTFLKWVGGKRKLLDKIDENLPEKFNNYYEPFLGGGSVFFYMKQKFSNKNFIISDINEDLINTYKDIRDNPKEIINHLGKLKKLNSKEFYYKVRESFNKKKFAGVKRSAIFIYMNKVCFNGIYRVNLKNEFNVPYGNYNDPEIFNEETILFASKLLQDVKIICQDYEKLKDKIKEDDFVYLDPCYDPIKKTSFANYTPNRFSDEDNDRMSEFVKYLKERKVYFLFSNNLTNNVKRLYPKIEGFIWVKIDSFRSVGSKGNYRGFVPELLIKNYS